MTAADVLVESGFTLENPEDCGHAGAVVDPFEPPMPGKVTADQALKFAESLIRGEPNRKKIALTASSDKVRELV